MTYSLATAAATRGSPAWKLISSRLASLPVRRIVVWARIRSTMASALIWPLELKTRCELAMSIRLFRVNSNCSITANCSAAPVLTVEAASSDGICGDSTRSRACASYMGGRVAAM